MADTKTERQTERSQEAKHSDRTLARQGEGYGLRRWDPAFASPFEFMDRMSEEIDRWFDRATRAIGSSRSGSSSHGLFGSHAREGLWFPRVEAFQKGDVFIVRADLPGLKKEDLEVDLTDDAVTIRGERRDEHQEQPVPSNDSAARGRDRRKREGDIPRRRSRDQHAGGAARSQSRPPARGQGWIDGGAEEDVSAHTANSQLPTPKPIGSWMLGVGS
jgi:HSP20 family molecular chaperone IbpA